MKFYLNNICKCGKEKSKKENGNYFRYCSPECHPGFGKKRPEHSRILKEQAKNKTNSSLFKKGHKNKFVNTPAWKRKVMENKGIDTSNMTDDYIVSIFTEWYSKNVINTRKAYESFITTIYDRFKNDYNLMEIFDIDNISKYTYDEILSIRKILNGIKTIEYNNNSGGKRFKRTLMNNFKYNIENQLEVYTRSSYETNYIKFFEKNKIWWSYETLKIKTNNSYTIPDFVFYYKDKKYILEVKGFLLDKEYYFNNKIRFVHDYAINNGFDLLFTYQSNPTSLEQLIQEKVKI